jgi:hypothetical protein
MASRAGFRSSRVRGALFNPPGSPLEATVREGEDPGASFLALALWKSPTRD